MKAALNRQWGPTGDSPHPSQVEPISDSMIWMQMRSTKRTFQLGIGAPQYITLGVFTAEPVTQWEITLPLWWKWLPCRKKIKAVDGWMVTGWSLIIWEIGLVMPHGLENDMSARAVGQNHLFCYWSRRPLLRCRNRGDILHRLIGVPP